MSITAAEITETLGWTDYAVIGVMLATSLGIGVYYSFTGGRQKTTEEYFFADHSMTVVPLALTLMGSLMSTVILLGISSEQYKYGTQMMALCLGIILGVPVSVYFYFPVFFKLQCISTYEYLEKRFGTKARLLASIVTALQLLLFIGVVLYAPALVMEATTGLSSDLSILLLGTICTFYSTIGGMKGVLMTDVFQGIFMLASVIMVIVFTTINVEGGIAGIWQLAVDGGRVEFDNFSFDPTMRHTWWGLTIGGSCIVIFTYGIQQVQVQRTLTVKTLKEAKLAVMGNCPLIVILYLLIFFSGIGMYAYFNDCDPMASGVIATSDMLMPYFVMKTMRHIPGLVGLFIAGILSTSLSTVSAMLNSLAAIGLEDYMKPSYVKLGYEFPKKREALIGQILAVVIGILGLLVAFLAKYMGSLIQTSISINGAIGGPILGIFSLGMFFESAEENGAIFGTLVGLAIVCWSAVGQPRPYPIPLPVSTTGCNATLTSLDPSTPRQVVLGDSSYFYLYRISYMWYAPLGLLVSVIVGLAVSNLLRLLTKQTFPEVNPDYFTPLVANRIRKRRLDVMISSKTQILTLEPHEINGVYPS